MRTIVINMPEMINLDDREAKILFASKLFEKRKVSIGQAAEIAGLTKKTFIEILSDYGVSVFNYSANDLNNDIENAKGYNIC